MEQSRFDQLAAQGHNRIPLTREILADMDTPLSAYRKVAEGAWSYLFESVQGGAPPPPARPPPPAAHAGAVLHYRSTCEDYSAGAWPTDHHRDRWG